jgi:hypothetical protein
LRGRGQSGGSGSSSRSQRAPHGRHSWARRGRARTRSRVSSKGSTELTLQSLHIDGGSVVTGTLLFECSGSSSNVGVMYASLLQRGIAVGRAMQHTASRRRFRAHCGDWRRKGRGEARKGGGDRCSSRSSSSRGSGKEDSRGGDRVLSRENSRSSGDLLG